MFEDTPIGLPKIDIFNLSLGAKLTESANSEKANRCGTSSCDSARESIRLMTDCDEMIEQWEVNTKWTLRSSLAKKILHMCDVPWV